MTTGTGKDDIEAFLKAAMAASAGIAELIPSLPIETRCQPFHLRQLGGFWLPEMILPGVAAVHARFEPRPDDVFLASFPKSGTTWLKALAFATLNRDQHPPSDAGHPLRLRSPHDCVSFFELPFALAEGSGRAREDVFEAFPSPRVLATHLPYHLLPERVVAEGSGGRIVYVCRDPKDAFVSGWLFTKKKMAADAAKGNAGVPPPPYPLEQAFELFCDGRSVGGPQWLHVLGYWEESRRRPDKVLFLRYEDMLRDPAGNVNKLAEFMGCPFSGEEEAAGVVDAVVELCSLDSLKGSKGNRSGTTKLNIENGSFFRKGAAGDWRNHLTPEMAARLDEIVDGALQGSGFTFGAAAHDSM
ncbi:Cytosolic sulfotransferase 5 [Dichanthelium oligosanthes]|uniref:Sulfotransferase n=1 Tax=Dichanthelium oligosanthes TaxID=888268 RepID=A0A1E5V5F6_9POAL|nr:Cytosolic sulfotransferase 5 [Dichanthelium oligosanthes]